MDARRAVPEPADRLRRQLEPQRHPPHAVRACSAPDVAAPVGGGGLLAGVRRACCSPPARSATASGARARCSSAWPSSSSRACSRPRRPRCGSSSPAARVMGVGAAFIMPSTLSILVNVFPPEERTKAIAIWASVTGAAGRGRPGRQRLAARPLLVRVGVPRQRADHRGRAGRRLVPRAEVEGSRRGPARSGRRGAVDRRDRRRSSTA